ncbi:MAG: CBS domain-containing protein [Candidatus Omnitrophica bacterium]|nr:CBS domain-containing protein [Candidatus Omnitrophota bacterium]
MKVKEIMIRNVRSISADISVGEAFKILSEMQISGLPVIDENGKLCGMFTEKDILKTILPSYIEKVGRFVYLENPKGINIKISELVNLKVKDIMRKEVVTVGEDTAVCEVARIMITQKIRRIPVVDKENKVLGIVARQDVLKALLGDYTK